MSIEPRAKGLTPNYQERSTTAEARRDAWVALANAEGTDGAAVIQADAAVSVAEVQPGGAGVKFEVRQGRVAYVHVASGTGGVEQQAIEAGDAVTVEAPGVLRLTGKGDRPMQVLWFDLPA